MKIWSKVFPKERYFRVGATVFFQEITLPLEFSWVDEKGRFPSQKDLNEYIIGKIKPDRDFTENQILIGTIQELSKSDLFDYFNIKENK